MNTTPNTSGPDNEGPIPTLPRWASIACLLFSVLWMVFLLACLVQGVDKVTDEITGTYDLLAGLYKTYILRTP